jgi:hypothetical protein
MLAAVTVALCCFAAPGVRACSIPVFRYALEHWAASPYEVVVFAKGELAAADRAMLEELLKKPVNVEVRTVDVSGEMSSADEAIWKARATKELPWAVIRFPASDEQAPHVWAGRLDKTALAGQFDSPARRELTRRLLAGESCVWVLLEGGEKAQDDRLEAQLVATLKRLEQSIQLPEIAPDGPQLHSPLPLRLSFSVLRVSRTDPREAALVRMLQVAEPELADSAEPLVIPVLGRGRAISALAASRVNDRSLGDFAQFICGQCSCEVKELNPGIDLLLAADWEVIFGDRQAEPEDPAKVAAGSPVPISSFAAVITPPTAAPDLVSNTGSALVNIQPPPHRLRREWLVAGIILTAVLALLSGAVALRARRK